MHFTCRSFIGKSSKGNWSQYWENEPDDSFLISQHGHLFGLINLSTDSDSDQASQLGRQIIAQINKSYFSSSTEENPLKKLQNSLDSVVTDHSLTSTTTIVTAVIFQQTLYLAVFHTGHCILQRSDQISPLLSGKSDQVTFISGPIRAEDKLFLCSDTFFQKITWSKIKTFLAVDSIQHIEEEILASLYSFDDQARLSAVIIQLHSDQPGDTEPLKEEALPEIPETSPSVVTPTPSPSPWTRLRQKLFRKKDIYISHRQIKQMDKRKRINIVIALVLLVALTVSAVFGFRKNQSAAAETQFQQLSTQIEEKLKDATDVKNLSIDSAKEFAAQAEELLQQIKALGLHPQQVDTFHQQIQTILSQTGSSQNLDIKFLHDTSTIATNPQYTKMIFSPPTLYLIDKDFGRVDSLNVDQKSTKNISISDDIKSTISLVESNNAFYLLTSQSVSRLSKTGADEKIKLDDVDFSGSPLDIQSWNNALYMLTSDSIIKFTPSGSVFSSSVWLQENQSLPSSPSSFAINGKVWVLSSAGKLQPFIRGQSDSFKPEQPIEAQKAQNLVTSIDGDLLAFTDNQTLIYVYQKNGDLRAKYDLGDKKINDIALDESTNTIYILCHDQKIYKINISP